MPKEAYLVVRLEAEFALERRLHGALDTTLAGEERAAKLSLDEELAVEDARSRVEWCAWDGRVNVVLRSDSVAMEHIHEPMHDK